MASNLLALAGATPFAVLEASSLAAYGWGWASAWGLLGAAPVVLQVRNEPREPDSRLLFTAFIALKLQASAIKRGCRFVGTGSRRVGHCCLPA